MSDRARINVIVDKLTRKLPTHNYLIGLNEAKNDIKLHVSEAKGMVNNVVWELYKEYESWLKLTSPVSAENDIGGEEQKPVRYERAVVECLNNRKLSQFIFVTDKTLMKTKMAAVGMPTPMEQIVERIRYQGWLSATDGEENK